MPTIAERTNDDDGTIRTAVLPGNAPAVDSVVPAGLSVVVIRKLTIASGKKETVGLAGILRIL